MGGIVPEAREQKTGERQRGEKQRAAEQRVREGMQIQPCNV